jgi:hypothetical protein
VSGKRSYNITALQRGLTLLQLFAKSEKGFSATEVAKSSFLPVSTVHRLLVFPSDRQLAGSWIYDGSA